MATCATYDGSGQVIVITPPPSDLSACALLIPSGSEGITNPFALSAADGAAIASAIVLVWGAGFVGRALIRSLFLGDDSHDE
jgi:hypothetical protein